MSIALWCVLIAALMPYALVLIAKRSGEFDNREPRAVTLEGFRRRAYSAHQNALETFPFFAVAVLVAQTNGGPTEIVNRLAMLYVVARVVHAVAYLSGKEKVRSIAFSVGFAVAVAIFVTPLFR